MDLKDKKIAVVSFNNLIGGVSWHIRSIVSHLNGHGLSFKVLLCSKVADQMRDAIASDGAMDPRNIIIIPHAKKMLFLPFIAELIGIFHREKFDIVDAFDDQTQVLAGLAARFAGIKVFLCHDDGRFAPSTVSWPKRMLYRGGNFFLKSYFTRTIAVSNGIAKGLIKEGLRPRSRVEVVHLGISPLHQGASQELTYAGFMSRAPVIGTLSRLSVEKGLDRFIRAAALVLKEVPTARFVICGQGPQEHYLKALAKELLIDDRLEFRPFPGRTSIKDVLQTYDIYTLPSLREGLPTTLLEAMSMARPTVASDIDGVREAIEDGIDGILVDTADTQAFARKIIGLCHNVPQAIAMGQRGLEKVRSSFNVEREMRRLREIYHHLR